MSTTTSTALIYWTLGVFTFLILWEHIASEVIPSDRWKPSFFLRWCYEHARAAFLTIGGWLAVLSSYLYRLKMERLLHSSWVVIKASGELILSPFYILRGYLDTAWSYTNPWMIAAGSIILCGFFLWWFWPWVLWVDGILHISHPSPATIGTLLICVVAGAWACYAPIRNTATGGPI